MNSHAFPVFFPSATLAHIGYTSKQFPTDSFGLCARVADSAILAHIGYKREQFPIYSPGLCARVAGSTTLAYIEYKSN